MASWFLIERRMTELKPVSFDLHTRARDVSVNRTGTCDVSWDSCHDRNVTFGIADRSNVIPGWHVSWGLFLHFLIQSQSLFNPAPPVCSGYYLCVICLFLCLFVCVLVFLYACAVSEVVFPSGGVGIYTITHCISAHTIRCSSWPECSACRLKRVSLPTWPQL